MLQIQAASNITLEDIKQHLIRVENVMKNHMLHPFETHDALIAHVLPLTVTNKIKEFDLLLKTMEEVMKQFVSIYITQYLYIFY